MKYFVVAASILVGSYSFAFAQTGVGSPGGSPGTSAGQDGASNGATGTNSGEGSTTGVQGTTGAGGGPQGNPTNSINDHSVSQGLVNVGDRHGSLAEMKIVAA